MQLISLSFTKNVSVLSSQESSRGVSGVGAVVTGAEVGESVTGEDTGDKVGEEVGA